VKKERSTTSDEPGAYLVCHMEMIPMSISCSRKTWCCFSSRITEKLGLLIQKQVPVSLTRRHSLVYLINFSKATLLSLAALRNSKVMILDKFT
jgi:hypothetical protein